jgi:hypothetical protein
VSKLAVGLRRRSRDRLDTNGQIWQQAEYDYEYEFAFQPEVKSCMTFSAEWVYF